MMDEQITNKTSTCKTIDALETQQDGEINNKSKEPHNGTTSKDANSSNIHVAPPLRKQ